MRCLCTLVLAALAVATASRDSSADSGEPHGLVRFRSFGAADGLHNLVVSTIAQDGDGLLWIGTDDGIYRYDGERFTHFGAAEGLRSTELYHVAVGPQGHVCAGTRLGIDCWNGERFVVAGTGLPEVGVRAIATAGGRLWLGTELGLYVRDGAGVFRAAAGFPAPGAVRVVWGDDRGLVAAAGGRVWTSAGDGRWAELSGVGLEGDRVDDLVRDPAGALWVRTALHVWRIAPGAARAEDLTQGMPSSYDNVGRHSMAVGARGEVLFGSDFGVVTREGDHWRLIDRRGGLPSAGARTVMGDRDGAMWVGSVGLFQERGAGLVERFDLTNGLPGDVAWSIARDREGALWVGTNRCLARLRAGRWECLAGTEGRVVRAFVFAPQGGVFVGGAPSDLLYVAPDGHTVSLGGALEHPTDHAIRSMRLGPEGDLWVGTKFGLFRVRGAAPGELERVEIPGLPPDVKVNTLTLADGRLWASTNQGLAVHDRDAWRVFGQADGLAALATRYLVQRHDREYCVGFIEAIGVTCFEYDGRSIARLRSIGVADGLVSGSVYFLGTDRERRLWVGTGAGVSVVTPRGIDHFGQADGLAGDDAAGNAFFLDRDGSVWLGSTDGLSHVLAQRYDGPPAPPRVVVRGGQLGRQALGSGARGPLVTSHDHNALRLELGTDRLADASRLSYEYRLWPLEQAWSATPLRQAHYPSLPHGDYRFEARARLTGGAWGAVTAVAFTVQPAWWQARWFIAAASLSGLLAIVAALVVAYRRALRRRTHQLHERSAASVRALLESVPDLISVHRGAEVLYVNHAARRVYGIDAEQGTWAELSERIHPDDRARFEALLTGRAGPGGAPALLELRVRGAQGGWRICEVSGAWMELAGATVLVASGRDVTESRALRAQLLVSDRMASLGTLAAGIAHEINNPLAYVLGNLELLEAVITSGGDTSSDTQGALHDAIDGAVRVKQIVAGLRSFSRADEEHRTPLELAGVLDAAIRLTANEVRHRAQLIRALGATPQVVADDGRLTQVFMNLIVNAAHAIPEGATDDNQITVRTRTDDAGRAVVEVVDTGLGMTPEVLARVFDPFYTTKGVGSGTGLGLSICHGIVTSLGGTIEFESTPGHGTVARVTLPAAPAPAVAAAPSQAVPAAAPGRLHVLVVDDEPLVVEMLARALRRDHDVVAVSCGADALAHLRRGAWFDAIVSDVMMPNMTGLQLLDAIADLSPAQARRLIFLSGGAFTAETRARLDELGTIQLAKPIAVAELRAAVLAVADAACDEPGEASAARATG